MAGLLIPRREIWTRQPQVFSGFNAAFPRPAFAFCASLGLLDLAAQKIGTKASGDALRATSQGMAYKVARATNGGLDFGTMQAITSDAFSVLVLSNGTSTDGIGALISQRIGSAPFASLALYLNASNVFGARAGALALITVDSGGIARGTHSTSTGLVNGGYHVFGATKASASSNPVLWYDGVIAAGPSSGTGTGSILNAAQKVRIGNTADYTADGTLCSASDIVEVLLFNGVVPDPVIKALSETLLAPYRVFQARPRYLLFPSLGAYTLNAASGSYSVTGLTAAARTARKIAAASGSYSLAGQDARLKAGHALSAGSGSYAIAGQNAALFAVRKLAAAPDAYAVSGQSATLVRGATLSAASGSYAVAGSPAALLADRLLAAALAGYAVSGQNATLSKGSKVAAGAGSYVLAGAAATLRVERALGLAPGSYSIAGHDASLVYVGTAKVLAAAAGAYSVSGQSAVLARTAKLAAATGSYTVAGSPAALLRGWKIAAAAGSYAVSGSAANLTYVALQKILAADPGAYSIAGSSAALRATRKLALTGGAYLLSGQPSALRRGYGLSASPGSVAITGQPAAFAHYRRLHAAAGSYALAGYAAQLNRTAAPSLFVHGNKRVFEIGPRERYVLVKRE